MYSFKTVTLHNTVQSISFPGSFIFIEGWVDDRLCRGDQDPGKELLLILSKIVKHTSVDTVNTKNALFPHGGM